MKKVLCALAAVALVASCAFAAVFMTPRVGFLTRLNTSETEFAQIIQNANSTTGWHLLSNRHELYGVKFFDSLMTMQMALNRGEIDEIALPEVVAEYLLKANPDFDACCAVRTRNPMALVFGFSKDNVVLASKFNRALRMIDEDWTLAEIQGVYIYNNGIAKPVKFDHFDGADTVKVAVTGDMPPIDYIDEAGNPAGFNAALLAELGRRMQVNIELLNVEAGARTAALVSGRADVVFWYETAQGIMWNYDASDEVLLSDPYFSWNKFLHIRKKDQQ
ncbi:MAG: transporter substrate-binding domain-containing protein [Synergistaceae bacterium]|nr:transporter substrate-binding domain-containing protein [Synergistaceae bacterium]